MQKQQSPRLLGGKSGLLMMRGTNELVADAARANAMAAAVKHDRVALIAQPHDFRSAQRGIDGTSFGDLEVAILNVRGPGADRGLDYVRARGLSGKRALPIMYGKSKSWPLSWKRMNARQSATARGSGGSGSSPTAA